ncbi:uncharacterized protein MYCFIDRAFT_82322 [Pseudocercospora fijiensis CIRAD86]|uniref:Uncharacterized protein n=1 Tax=Pseudocercospora fijiensis (strain CIRAD86) TaxID=383855 RepID=M3AYZ9_PSEFD|nr:uncharacterized protein MYCFIDRAFT_82322 [Pseudocercospora fijiensis CIRAD86]EME82403.1 hypothetical protein MYCFIDRAFT_82322 [Pseudocercospora fijiensis CIRAD86]
MPQSLKSGIAAPIEHDMAATPKVSTQLAVPTPTPAGATMPSTTFFDLPPEIRNIIYDMVTIANTPSPYSPDGSRIPTHLPPWNLGILPTTTPALSQVNKQIRQEALPRHHMIYGLQLLSPSVQSNAYSKTAEMWLEAFGRTRIPMTRKFLLFGGRRDLKILLRGAPDFPKQVKKAFLVRVTNPFDPFYHYDVEEIEAFIEPRLKQNGAGVFLDFDDVLAILAKVRKMSKDWIPVGY